MNKIIVIGHLGRDPGMRYTPNGQGITSFSIANSRRYTTTAGELNSSTAPPSGSWLRPANST